ncbi:MAG TPA: hypothetical protein VJ936_09275, partial [Desulfobacteraceae bacterium]|nr:hypothetical protein [Desulfobacteraceae bacterium]
QELRPLVLKQLDFLNAWQGKKSYLLWFSMFLTGQALGALNRLFHIKNGMDRYTASPAGRTGNNSTNSFKFPEVFIYESRQPSAVSRQL